MNRLIDTTALKTRIKLGLTRIILTRTAFIFFLVAFISGVAQIGAVSYSYQIDTDAQNKIFASIPPNLFNMSAVATVTYSQTQSLWAVRLCTKIDDVVHPHYCDYIDLTPPNSTILDAPVLEGDPDTCHRALNYPYQLLDLAQREDVFNVSINAWMLFICLYAVMTESIPHLLAFFMGKCLATIWTVWTVIRLPRFEEQFTVLLQTICNNDPAMKYVATTFFQETQVILFVSALINLVSLIISAYVCYRLGETYARKTYTLVCAPPELIPKYKLVLAVNATEQLGLFFFFASAALWYDRLKSEPTAHLVRYPVLYQAEIWVSFVVIPFWVLIGWIGVRREKRILTFAFLFIGFALLVVWSVLFYSIIYRWYFVTWAFWAGITVASMLLLIVILVLAALCWRNFGSGVGHWLSANRHLASQDFKPTVFDRDPAKPDIASVPQPRRPSSLYHAELKRFSNGLSFQEKGQWEDPFVDPISHGEKI